MSRFFSYDINDGLDWHDTAEKAREAAQHSIDLYREEAPSYGWAEETGSVCWGEVHEQAQECDRVTPEDLLAAGEDYEAYRLKANGQDYRCDYKLEPVGPDLRELLRKTLPYVVRAADDVEVDVDAMMLVTEVYSALGGGE